MRRRIAVSIAMIAAGVVFFAVRHVHLQADRSVEADHGSLIQYDADVARREPGTHNGGGETTGYSFFAKAPNPALIFRKRALHPGSAIGSHRQDVDEVYYVLSGKGELTLDAEKHEVGPGAAILTRPGSTHSLKQTGAEDLVIVIAYPPEMKR